MPNIFGKSWYVDRGRIQSFLPLNGSIAFEIDRTGVGGLLGSPVFSTNYGNASLEYGRSPVNAMVFDGSKYFLFNDRMNQFLNNAIYGSGRKASICFWVWTGDDTNSDGDGTLANSRGVSNNVVLSDNYFSGYSFGRETMTSIMDMTDDTTKGEVSADIDSHVVTARFKVAESPEERHSLLVDGDEGFVNIPSNKWVLVTYTLDHSDPDNYLTTINLRFMDDNGNHKHYYCSGTNMDAYTIDGELKSVVGRTGGAWTLGCSRVPSGNSYVFSKFLTGALRNFMLYSIVLDDSQQETMYENGIDPYVADKSPNTDPDVDQYDYRFFGKYGMIATGSMVKMEKTQIRKTSQASLLDNQSLSQNLKRFSLASRDGSSIVVARDDIQESDTVNPDVFDSTAAPNEWGSTYDAEGNDLTEVEGVSTTQALSVAAWRGGAVSGDSKISRLNSKAIWGGMIDGITDIKKLVVRRLNANSQYEDINNPETLPSGKYIARLIDNGSAPDIDLANTPGRTFDGYLFYYPSYLPRYYYRDRLGRSWRKDGSVEAGSDGNNYNSGTFELGSNLYVNEIFWNDDVKRYDKIDWTKAYLDITSGTIMNASSDEVQLDDAESWDKIDWEFAIYEVDREPRIISAHSQEVASKAVAKIKLTLISSDFKYSATYYKFRNPQLSDYFPSNPDYGVSNSAFSGWHFESFNFGQSNASGDQSEDHLYKEKVRRIFLPHVVIPRLTIPLFETGVAAVFNNSDIDSASLSTNKLGCQGLIFYAKVDYTEKMKAGLNGQEAGDLTPIPCGYGPSNTAPVSGYYMACVKVLVDGNDNWKYPQVSFAGYAQTIVERYRTGGGENVAYSTTADINLVGYVAKGNPMQIVSDFPVLSIAVIYLSNPAVTGSGFLSGVNVSDDSGTADWQKYVRTSEGRKYIEIEGIAAKYTRQNYKSKLSGGFTGEGATTDHVPVADTISNQGATQYEE